MRTDGRAIPALREYAGPTLTLLALTLVSILLHSKWCGTPMLASEQRWREIVDYHVITYPFSIRYFTTYLVLGVNKLTGLPLKETFFALQYLLMGAVSLVLYRFLRLLKLNRGLAHIGMLLFLISFPVIFAHSEPVFTWDDGWTYLFLLLSTIALLKCRIWPATIYFTVGCFAREQMLFYLPVFVLGVFTFCRELPLSRKLTAIAIPIILYGAFYAATFQPPDQKRFELLQYNFENFPKAMNSLFSLFISFGAVWAAWFFSLQEFTVVEAVGTTARRVRFLAWASLLAVIPTVVLGTTFALARETRIFFPPFVFMFPLVLFWLRQRWRRIDGQWADLRLTLLVAATALAMWIGIWKVRTVMPNLDYRNCPDFCYLWTGIHFGLTVAVILFALITARKAKLVSVSRRSKLS